MAITEKLLSHTDTTKYEIDRDLFISLHDIPENHEIDKKLLNIENKVRSNLLPWKGQFSPQLIELLLEKYSTDEFILFDPFLGSGTLLVEGVRRNLSVLGTEINPAAYHLSNIYSFCNLSVEDRRRLFLDFENEFSLFHHDDYGLFQNDDKKNNIDILLKYLETGHRKDFKKLIQGLIILLDTYKNGSDNSKILIFWNKLKELILKLPFTFKKIDILNTDARNVQIDDNSIDLVITSPPYINVFNYHQQYRESAELLGDDVLKAARSEIGSNRKHRGNRFLTVIQYISDMYSVFIELERICKHQSKIVFIVGRESNVRKTSFYNSEIISSVAKIAGFDIKFRQERVFLNRFGQQIYEDIIHFSNDNIETSSPKELLRKLSFEVLMNAIERAPKESLNDLHSAITSITQVKESPIYSKD